jgi:UDP-N-acetylmuramoylalanine--D-glutamate ligase
MEVGRIFGVSPETCFQVFGEFKGVEHRLELVRTLGGVDFINDSKATTAEAGRWALESLEKPIHMICGGRDKHIDFSVLKELVHHKVKKMYVIGEAKTKLKNTFEGVVVVEECGSLEDAVSAAKKNAKPGECVTLSPMCASFDMFLNFEERGRIFKEIVCKL